MEPEVRAFLILIMQSVSTTLLWMMLNMTAGIYFNLAFIEGEIKTANIVYYIFFLVSFFLLIRYLRRKWKGFKEVSE